MDVTTTLIPFTEFMGTSELAWLVWRFLSNEDLQLLCGTCRCLLAASRTGLLARRLWQKLSFERALELRFPISPRVLVVIYKGSTIPRVLELDRVFDGVTHLRFVGHPRAVECRAVPRSLQMLDNRVLGCLMDVAPKTLTRACFDNLFQYHGSLTHMWLQLEDEYPNSCVTLPTLPLALRYLNVATRPITTVSLPWTLPVALAHLKIRQGKLDTITRILDNSCKSTLQTLVVDAVLDSPHGCPKRLHELTALTRLFIGQGFGNKRPPSRLDYFPHGLVSLSLTNPLRAYNFDVFGALRHLHLQRFGQPWPSAWPPMLETLMIHCGGNTNVLELLPLPATLARASIHFFTPYVTSTVSLAACKHLEYYEQEGGYLAPSLPASLKHVRCSATPGKDLLLKLAERRRMNVPGPKIESLSLYHKDEDGIEWDRCAKDRELRALPRTLKRLRVAGYFAGLVEQCLPRSLSSIELANPWKLHATKSQLLSALKKVPVGDILCLGHADCLCAFTHRKGMLFEDSSEFRKDCLCGSTTSGVVLFEETSAKAGDSSLTWETVPEIKKHLRAFTAKYYCNDTFINSA